MSLERHKRVVGMLEAGMTVSDIAYRFHVSPSTDPV